jgi:hypothetical protein
MMLSSSDWSLLFTFSNYNFEPLHFASYMFCLFHSLGLYHMVKRTNYEVLYYASPVIYSLSDPNAISHTHTVLKHDDGSSNLL